MLLRSLILVLFTLSLSACSSSDNSPKTADNNVEDQANAKIAQLEQQVNTLRPQGFEFLSLLPSTDSISSSVYTNKDHYIKQLKEIINLSNEILAYEDKYKNVYISGKNNIHNVISNSERYIQHLENTQGTSVAGEGRSKKQYSQSELDDKAYELNTLALDLHKNGFYLAIAKYIIKGITPEAFTNKEKHIEKLERVITICNILLENTNKSEIISILEQYADRSSMYIRDLNNGTVESIVMPQNNKNKLVDLRDALQEIESDFNKARKDHTADRVNIIFTDKNKVREQVYTLSYQDKLNAQKQIPELVLKTKNLRKKINELSVLANDYENESDWLAMISLKEDILKLEELINTFEHSINKSLWKQERASTNTSAGAA